MKKILFTLSICLCLVSCNFTTENSKQVHDIHGTMMVKEFTYNGHDYLEFKDFAEYGFSVEHNPECKKCFDFFD